MSLLSIPLFGRRSIPATVTVHRPPAQPERTAAKQTLALHATDRFTGAAGQWLACSRGCLWITQDGDPKDVILSAGQHCTLGTGRQVLVHALEPSAYRLYGTTR